MGSPAEGEPLFVAGTDAHGFAKRRAVKFTLAFFSPSPVPVPPRGLIPPSGDLGAQGSPEVLGSRASGLTVAICP